MPVITRIVSLALRVGELIFATVVAGLIGSYLHDFDKKNAWPKKRFVYTEVIAGVSILLSLLWLLPFASSIFGWPMDLILAAAWFAAFALLVDSLHGQDCGRTFNWSGITNSGLCNRWKAAEAFSFLSAIFWLVSAIIGLWAMAKARRERDAATGDVDKNRGRWYRGPRV